LLREEEKKTAANVAVRNLQRQRAKSTKKVFVSARVSTPQHQDADNKETEPSSV
jgi:hypothetical protein